VGALVLFLSNLIALVLAGTLVFTTLSYTDKDRPLGGPQRRASLGIAILMIVVGIPLVSNTVGAYVVSLLTARAETTVEEWISGVPGGQVESVDLASNVMNVNVRVPGDLPSTDSLMTALNEQLPGGITIIVNGTQGSYITAGQTQ
jgi:hypothetical protein